VFSSSSHYFVFTSFFGHFTRFLSFFLPRNLQQREGIFFLGYDFRSCGRLKRLFFPPIKIMAFIFVPHPFLFSPLTLSPNSLSMDNTAILSLQFSPSDKRSLIVCFWSYCQQGTGSPTPYFCFWFFFSMKGFSFSLLPYSFLLFPPLCEFEASRRLVHSYVGFFSIVVKVSLFETLRFPSPPPTTLWFFLHRFFSPQGDVKKI